MRLRRLLRRRKLPPGPGSDLIDARIPLSLELDGLKSVPLAAYPSPRFFVSADSKRLSLSVSSLESILMGVFASVDSKGLGSKHKSCSEFAVSRSIGSATNSMTCVVLLTPPQREKKRSVPRCAT